MTNSHNGNTLPDVITAEEMADLIRAGRAAPWDQPLGNEVPTAALVDGEWEQISDGEWILLRGTWYAVFVDRQDGAYEPASAEQAAVFTDFFARLRQADDTLTRTATAAGPPPQP
jgi:hypothetical protein